MPPAHTLTEQDHALLHELRQHRRHVRHAVPRHMPTLGSRTADLVAAAVGSWRFILIQSALLAIWLTGNAVVGADAWDPYPFILLNLLLSFQAAYTAPIIMMSQNRQSDVDREHAEDDYRINVKAELEIELLHQKIDMLREQELLALANTVNELIARLDGRPDDGKDRVRD